MTKRSGLGQNIYVGGYDLSGDYLALNKVSTSMKPIEGVTGIDKYAMERLAGLKDGSIDATVQFNKAAGREHPVLSAMPRTDTMVSYLTSTTLGDQVALLVAKQTNYDGTRPDNGDLKFKVGAQGNAYGLEWGQNLTAGKRTDTTATNGSSVDTTSSLSFGLQAYLQVFAFSGTNVTIKIQDSADNSSWADLTSGAFTQVTAAPTFERIQTSRTQTVRRYVRVVTSGTFTSVTFHVGFVKNPVTVNF